MKRSHVFVKAEVFKYNQLLLNGLLAFVFMIVAVFCNRRS